MQMEKPGKGAVAHGCTTPSNNQYAYVAPGMPPLDMSGKQVSVFEFWPSWVMYAPVVVSWFFLALRYRSLSLPLIANPRLFLSGMVGAHKSDVFSQASGRCQAAILPWVQHIVSSAPAAEQVAELLESIEQKGLDFPLVAKPDMGCRGAGVKLVSNATELESYLDGYPPGASLLVQKLASWEPEAGVFYVRYPNEKRGRIISLGLKYSPYVVGNGQSTLAELIAADPRASELKHLYHGRFQAQWHDVIDAGQPFKLVFSASHCRGAIFRDGTRYISKALVEKLDSVLADVPEFHFGRLDIKFKSLESLQNGEDFEIVEINGASSESLHIWDRHTPLKEAFTALLSQYRYLFEIGHLNRHKGYKPPGALALIKAWQKEKQLTQYYPQND